MADIPDPDLADLADARFRLDNAERHLASLPVDATSAEWDRAQLEHALCRARLVATARQLVDGIALRLRLAGCEFCGGTGKVKVVPGRPVPVFAECCCDAGMKQ